MSFYDALSIARPELFLAISALTGMGADAKPATAGLLKALSKDKEAEVRRQAAASRIPPFACGLGYPLHYIGDYLEVVQDLRDHCNKPGEEQL